MTSRTWIPTGENVNETANQEMLKILDCSHYKACKYLEHKKATPYLMSLLKFGLRVNALNSKNYNLK